jgi:Holliday junction DNA helicase RuvA
VIATLRGTLLEKQPTRLVVEVGGVGFDVHVPLPVSSGLGELGSAVRLFTTLVVREDALTLYGFRNRLDRDFFLKLTGVSGIGPRIALNALSGASVQDVVAALRGEDASVLIRLPGIGRKTAERMILELKDSLAEFAGEAVSPRGRTDADAVEALVSLGYSRAASEKAVRKAGAGETARSVETLVREALRGLVGGG